jgi:hypothetical protein
MPVPVEVQREQAGGEDLVSRDAGVFPGREIGEAPADQRDADGPQRGQ